MTENQEDQTCSGCKFWGVDWDRVCSRVNHLDNFGSDKGFEIKVRADDDQGLEAQLLTGPGFGCVKFEVKLVFRTMTEDDLLRWINEHNKIGGEVFWDDFPSPPDSEEEEDDDAFEDEQREYRDELEGMAEELARALGIS